MSKAKRWPEDYPYRFFIGMHTVDYDQNATIPDLLSEMDGREIIRRLSDAGVDAVYFYASCHAGNCFYPTEVEPGHMHTGLKGRDVFGEAADEAQKLDVAFLGVFEFAHYRFTDWGPREWFHYYPEAGPNNKTGLCFNTGYGDFVKAQIDELARRYPMQGMYVDMLSARGPLLCPECARRFKAETGLAPPRVIDPKSVPWQVHRVWRDQDEARYIRELRSVLQAHQPGATLVTNMFVERTTDLYEVPTATDYLTHDPGIGFGFGAGRCGTARLAVLAHMYRALSRGRYPFEFLYDPILHGVLSVIPPKPYEAVSSMTPAHGGTSAYPSSMIDRVGKLNPGALGLTQETSAFTKARYPWRGAGEPVRFAGLYVSQESIRFNPFEDAPDRYSAHVHALDGAYLMLQQAHLPVDVLTRRDLGRLGEYAVVVLPEVVCMSDAERDALRKYVHEGGTLVADFRTSLADEWGVPRADFGLADLFGVRYAGRELRPVRGSHGIQLPLPDGLYETAAWEHRNITLAGPALVCRADKDATQLVPLHDRYRKDPDKATSVLHNAYTKLEPEGPGLVEHRVGRGRCLYHAGRMFETYQRVGTPSLRRLVVEWPLAEEIDRRALVRLDAPSSVELVAWAQPDRDRMLVHLVNFQSAPGRVTMTTDMVPETEDVLPAVDCALRTAFKPEQVRAATLQPAGTPLEVVAQDGRAVVKIPRIEIHDIVELSLAPGACPAYPDSDRCFDYPRVDVQAKVREFLADPPADYDPEDPGTYSLEKWRPTEDYLIDWMVAGPFAVPAGAERGLDQELGPEADPSLDAVYTGLEGVEVRWDKMAGPQVNLHGQSEMVLRTGVNRPGVAGYLRTVLRSEAAQTVRFWIGNDDACKVLVNGEEVFRRVGSADERHVGPDQAQFTARLEAGDNVLLVKVVNVGHGMSVYLRAEDPEAPLQAAATPDGPWRDAASAGARGEEWDGRGQVL